LYHLTLPVGTLVTRSSIVHPRTEQRPHDERAPGA